METEPATIQHKCKRIMFYFLEPGAISFISHRCVALLYSFFLYSAIRNLIAEVSFGQHKRYLRIFLIALSLLTVACNRVKQKTKEAISKTGETVGQSTSEFVKGVSKGVDETFDCKISASKAFEAKGVQYGKFKISSSDSAKDDVLTLYIIFTKDFKGSLSAKVFDSNGQEYGRTAITAEGKSGEAKYVDFTFDKRTEIESKSTFVIE